MANELPPEILRQIFAPCEDIARSHRGPQQPYRGAQDTIAQVCQHWRMVAINTPELWDYIFITHPLPHPHAQLCLSRSGTAPLDLEIDMGSSFGSFRVLDDAQQSLYLRDTLAYICEYGGPAERWRSFILTTKPPLILTGMLEYLSVQTTPLLCFLSLTLKASNTAMYRPFPSVDDRQTHLPSSHLSAPSSSEKPRLRHVEFILLPNSLVFARNSSIMKNLTSLTFTLFQTLKISKLSALLSASPQIKLLDVTLNYVDVVPNRRSSFEQSQVRLPSLRSFSLHTIGDTKSERCIVLLAIIDAPGLEYLKISLDGPEVWLRREPASRHLIRYLCSGRVDGVLQSPRTILADRGQHPLDSGPIYPSLRHVDIRRLGVESSSVGGLLGAFSTATHISIGTEMLGEIARNPTILPNALYFELTGSHKEEPDDILEETIKVASRRVEVGNRIELLKIITDKKTEVQMILDGEVQEKRHFIHLRQLVGKVEIVQEAEPIQTRYESDGDTEEFMQLIKIRDQDSDSL